MKTFELPTVCVELEFRAVIESLLSEHETLIEFVENAVREKAIRRRAQLVFLTRSSQSKKAANRINDYLDGDHALEALHESIAAARETIRSRRGGPLISSN
jgi:ethanolamine utilization cobalamin adenosyltransferase